MNENRLPIKWFRQNWFKAAFLLLVLLGFVSVLQSKRSAEEVFANKERCAKYTEKQRLEAKRQNDLMVSNTTVEGFYSSRANTCMTVSVTRDYYSNRTFYSLIDELTGKTVASTQELWGAELTKMTTEAMSLQVANLAWFDERVKFFQGDK